MSAHCCVVSRPRTYFHPWSDQRLENVIIEDLALPDQVRKMRKELNWLLPRIKSLEPLAKTGAALKILRWWSKIRAKRNWDFVRDYLLGYLEAAKGWKTHVGMIKSP